MNIIITEQQFDIFKTLMEGNTPMLNGETTKEYGNPSEIGTSATLTDADGDPEPGKDVYTDEIGKFLANQDWRGCLRLRIG